MNTESKWTAKTATAIREASFALATAAMLLMTSAPTHAQVAQQPLFLSIPVAGLLAGAFVLFVFAARQGNFEFGAPVFPVQCQRYQCIALALDRADQSVELPAVQ